MSEAMKQEVGSINWTDLTVPEAEKVKDFYSAVVGWKFAPVDMGGYHRCRCRSQRGTMPRARWPGPGRPQKHGRLRAVLCHPGPCRGSSGTLSAGINPALEQSQRKLT